MPDFPVSLQRVLATLVACGIGSGILLSTPLWFAGADRLFPYLPLVAPGGSIPLLLTPIMSGVLLSAAILLAIPRLLSVVGPVVLLTAAGLILQDQSRLQPWLYQYLWFCIALYVCRTDNNCPSLVAAMQLMLAAIYFWAGISKCTASYFLHVFPAFFNPIVSLLESYPVFALILAALGPLLEIWIGISFLLLQHTRTATLVAVSLHALILLMLGPLGLHFNSVVWPWNLVMPLLAYFLFWNAKNSPRPIPALLRARPVFGCTLLLAFWLLPMVSKAGLWDHYLSFSLYSGRTPEATLLIRDVRPAQLPLLLRETGTLQDGTFTLPVNDWSYAALNVPAYPEVRVYRQVFHHVCDRFAGAGTVSLEWAEPVRAWSAERVFTTWNCRQTKPELSDVAE